MDISYTELNQIIVAVSVMVTLLVLALVVPPLRTMLRKKERDRTDGTDRMDRMDRTDRGDK